MNEDKQILTALAEIHKQLTMIGAYLQTIGTHLGEMATVARYETPDAFKSPGLNR